MRDAIDFLRKAVGSSEKNELLGCYIIQDGAIYAQNGYIQACVPVEAYDNCNIPAKDIEALIERGKSDLIFGYDEGKRILNVRSGRFRAAIQCPDGASLHVPSDVETWEPVPTTLIPALEKALPFVDKGGSWSSGIRLSPGIVTAVTNKCGIQIAVPDLLVEAAILLTKETVDFLTGTAPTEWSKNSNNVMFRWPDGRWMRAQLLNTFMPEVVDRLFNGITEVPTCEIDEDWKTAAEDAVALSESSLIVTHERITALRAASSIDIDIPLTGASEGLHSRWSADTLRIMISVATHWGPYMWPQHAPFIGHGCKGIIAAIRQ